jgi:hypothetical protein
MSVWNYAPCVVKLLNQSETDRALGSWMWIADVSALCVWIRISLRCCSIGIGSRHRGPVAFWVSSFFGYNFMTCVFMFLFALYFLWVGSHPCHFYIHGFYFIFYKNPRKSILQPHWTIEKNKITKVGQMKEISY